MVIEEAGWVVTMMKKNKAGEVTGPVSDDPVTSAFILFHRTARVVQKYGDAYFYHKLGISVIQFVILNALDTCNGVMTPSDIARWTQTERNNVTTLVSRLKRDGLVEVEKNLEDRRSISVILTAKGRKIHRQAKPIADEIVGLVMGSITETDAVSFEKLLKAMRENALAGMEELTRRGRSHSSIKV